MQNNNMSESQSADASENEENQKTFGKEFYESMEMLQKATEWMVNRQRKEGQCEMDWERVNELLQKGRKKNQPGLQYPTDQTQWLQQIQQQLRDTSNYIISTQIKQYNFKCSKQQHHSKQLKHHSQSIQEQCFSQMSTKMLQNYTNALKFIALSQPEPQKRKHYASQLQQFMKKHFSYIKVKYSSMEEQYEVMANKQVREKVQLLSQHLQQDSKAIIFDSQFMGATSSFIFQHSHLQQHEKSQAPNNQLISQMLNAHLQLLTTSLHYQQKQFISIIEQLHQSVEFSQEAMLGDKSKVTIDGFMTEVKRKWVKEVLLAMVQVMAKELKRVERVKRREKKGSKDNQGPIIKQDKVNDENKLQGNKLQLSKEQKQTGNVLQEKNLNYMAPHDQNKEKPKKPTHTKQLITETNPQAQSKLQQKQPQPITNTSNPPIAPTRFVPQPFSQHFISCYLDSYKQKTPPALDHLQTTKQQLLSICYDYSTQCHDLLFDQVVRMLRQMYHNMDKGTMGKFTMLQVLERMIYGVVLAVCWEKVFQAESRNKFIQEDRGKMFDVQMLGLSAQVQCNNQELSSVISKIIQLISSDKLNLIKSVNQLNTTHHHTLTLYFTLTTSNPNKPTSQSTSLTQQQPQPNTLSQPNTFSQLNSHYQNQANINNEKPLYTLPFKLRLRLDQQMQTLPVIRKNYLKLNRFLQSVENSQLGPLGRLSETVLYSQAV